MHKNEEGCSDVPKVHISYLASQKRILENKYGESS